MTTAVLESPLSRSGIDAGNGDDPTLKDMFALAALPSALLARSRST